MRNLTLLTLATSTLMLSSHISAQEKVAELPATKLQVVGALSNLTLYQNFEHPFWTETVPNH